VNELEDLIARRDLNKAFDDYALGMDLRNVDRFLSAWTPDAVWEMNSAVGQGVLRGTGHKEIEGVLRRLWTDEQLVQHTTANHAIVFDDETHAHGDGHTTCHGVNGAGKFFFIGAVYPADRYEKVDGVWRISFRRVECNVYAEFDPSELSDFQFFIGDGGAVGPEGLKQPI